MTTKIKLTPAQREELRVLYMEKNIHFVCLEKDHDIVKGYNDSSRLITTYAKGTHMYQLIKNNDLLDEVVSIQAILGK